MKIAVVDDNILDARRLRDIISHISSDDSHVIELFETGEDFLAAAGDKSFDLVFMDIYLGKENGIDIIRSMQGKSSETSVVFVTTSDSHAVAAFSLRALHYLVKPYTEEQIIEAIDRAKAKGASEPSGSTLTVCIGKDVYTIDQRDILRVEADDHKTNILMKNGSVYSTRLFFGKVEPELDSQFLTINRGIAVNMRHILKWGATDVEMCDGRSFLTNRRRRKQLKEAYFTYKMDEMSDRIKKDDGTYSK